MKLNGRSVALIVAAALLSLLAIGRPLAWLRAHDEVSLNANGTAPRHPAARWVAQLSQSLPLRAALRDQELIGYASESEIDLRSDGSGQMRYYLSQFALAPVLLELEPNREQGESQRELVLAAFQLPEQLSQYLSERARKAVVSLNTSVALTRKREP